MACPEIACIDRELCITMPGGMKVCSQVPGTAPPTKFALAASLLAQLQSSIAPLKPIFTIIEAVMALQKLGEAAKKALGPPPRPDKLVTALKEVAEKVGALAQLVPALSIPLMVLGFFDALLMALEGVVDELRLIVRQQERIDEAMQSGHAPLVAIAQCAQDLLDGQMCNTAASARPLNDLIGLVNQLGGMVPGMPEIPTLNDLGEDVSQAIDALASVLGVLRQLRSTIPI